MKLPIKLVLVATVSCFSMAIHAQGTSQDGTSAGDQAAAQAAQQQMGINEAAAQAAAAQKAAAMKNMMVGAALMATGMAGCTGMQTWGCPLLPMAALAFMQAGHDSNMAGLSDMTYDATTPETDLPGGGTGQDPTSPTGSGTGGGDTGFTDEVKKNLDKLASKGVTVDSKNGTVTTTDGSTMPASAFSSPGAMAAAGMSDATIKAAQDALAGAGGVEGMQASVGSMGVDGGGGGYSGAAGGSSEYQGSSLADYFNSLNKKKGDKDRLIAGKSLTYGKDPIGVKVDDIFMMVHRRYQKKRQVKTYFLERAPASKNK